MLIRSVFRGGPSVSVVQRLDDLMEGLSIGRYRSYLELLSSGQR
jgi:hypothetical protein